MRYSGYHEDAEVSGLVPYQDGASTLEEKRAALLRALERLAASEQDNRWPVTQPAIGTVLRFDHEYPVANSYGNKIYTYVALRATDGMWYLTGQITRSMDYASLTQMIGNASCEIVTGWSEVPQAVVPTPLSPEEWIQKNWPSSGTTATS